MRVKFFIKIFILSAALFGVTNIQSINYRSLVKTYADGSWSAWKTEIEAAEKNMHTGIDARLSLVNLYFGYTGHFIDAQNYEMAFENIHKAEVLINEILTIQPSNVTALSYKGAFMGFRVATNRFKYLATGLEGLSIIYKTYDMDHTNIIAIINKASALYFLPPVFGGSKTEAIRLLNSARVIMENSDQTVDNWMYLYTLIFIGRSYEKTGRLTEAKHTFEKVLRIEPEFKWVKNDLYPAVLRSFKEK